MQKIKMISLVIILVFLIANTGWADLNYGLLAYYPFDGNADDKSGNGYNGTVYGALLGVDRFGNSSGAYSFDGVDDYIDLGKVNLNLSSNFSISLWIKSPETKTYKVIFSKSFKASAGHYELYIGDTNYSDITGEVRFYAPNLDDEGTNDIKGEFGSTKSIDDNIYHHVLLTYDGNYITFFIDSSKVSQETASGNITEETELLYIGGHPLDSPQMFFEGLIDELRIYNRVLEEFEIKELYDSPQGACIDSDNDGVADIRDICPDTPLNSTVYSNGCPSIKGDFNNNEKLDLGDCIGILQSLTGIKDK